MPSSKHVLLISLVCLLMAMLSAYEVSAASTIVAVDPPVSTVTVTSSFSININVTDVQNLTSWEFKLFYSKTVLNCTNVAEGPFLKTYGSTTWPLALNITNNYNSTHGRVLAADSLLGSGVSVNGTGILATVTFQALAVGDTALHLYETKLGDEKIPPHPISHTDMDGLVHVTAGGLTNLVVDSIAVQNQGCNVYANDTYANSTAYYVLVYVDVRNVGGGGGSGAFDVSLSAYWINGSLLENYVEWRVAGLDAGTNTTLTFNWHPIHTGYYNLTAVADCHNEITETNEGDNSLVLASYPVAVMGDIKGDHAVNILDATVVSLAWGTHPGGAGWNIKADLNHDGSINILDGARVTTNWGRTW